MLKVCALYSGSSGNSIYVSDGTNLLVDIGVNGKEIEIAMQAIGESIQDINGILLTHEHIDHMRGLGVIMRRYKIPLYINKTTWDRMQFLGIGPVPENLVHIIDSDGTFGIGDLSVKSFRTPHDAVESVGFRITSNRGSVSVFTDIGVMTPEILDCVTGSDAVFIESNYDYDMLWGGSYPWYLKKRINGSNGHLSNSDCAQSVGYLLEKGTTRFILSHLSRENNLPELAIATTTEYLSRIGACEGKDFILQAARRREPSIPWTIS